MGGLARCAGRCRQRRCTPPRRQSGDVQRFADVNVAKAGDDALIHERRLERCLFAMTRAREGGAVEVFGQRLGPEPAQRRMPIEFSGRHQLHDDIGANFTRIAVLAEVVRRQKTVAPAADAPLRSIATVARESMTAMGEIVWAVNPDRDRVGDLTGRMREYAEEVFAADEVPVTFTVPEGLKDVRLGGDVRRDVYLVFKEAANNAARHSGCSNFHVEIARDRRWLVISITDDGRGFELTDAEGNGLVNMGCIDIDLQPQCQPERHWPKWKYCPQRNTEQRQLLRSHL